MIDVSAGEEDYSTTITGVVTISGSVTVTGSVTVSGTVAISGMVTVSGTVSISGTVTISGSVTVSNTVTVTGAVTVSGTVAISGTVTVSGTVAISGTVTISGAVTITSGTVTFTNTTIAVTGTVSITGTVTITGTVAISGSVTITGTVAISGTVTISGAVTITSGAVTITTVGGTNIIIDKLVQGAYVERRSLLTNDGGTPSMDSTIGVYRHGKFFPRGARGWLYYIDVYCDDAGASGGTITVYISPFIGAGYLYSIVITVAGGGAAGWRSAVFNKFWNYDSLFIWYVGSQVDMRVGFVSTEPYDCYYSDDSGATWSSQDYRHFLRAYYKGQTEGDIPVSGTINTIQIPSASTTRLYTIKNLPNNVETTYATIGGQGTTEYIGLYVPAATNSHYTRLNIYCDGLLVFSWYFALYSDWGFTASTPAISKLLIAADGVCSVLVTAKFQFRRLFEVKLLNANNAIGSCWVDGLVNLVK